MKSADRLSAAELTRFDELHTLVANPERRSPPNSDLTSELIAEWIALRDKRYPEGK